MLTLNKFVLLLTSFFLITFQSLSYAKLYPVEKEKSSAKNYQVQIVSPFLEVKKGEKNSIGLFIRLKKDWYTYWQYAGDTGKSLNALWELPEGLSIDEQDYPLPERYSYKIASLEGTSFIYNNQVLIPYEIFIPKNYSQDNLKISLKLELFICKDICVSYTEKISTVLKVLPEQSLLTPRPFYNDLFKKWKSKAPVKIHLKSFFKKKDDSFIINFQFKKPIKCLDVFPNSNQDFSTKKPRLLNQTTESCSFEVKKSENSLPILSGLLVYENQLTKSSSFFKSYEKGSLDILWFILMAFIGGLLLNIMPCVLPIIFLKFYNTFDVMNESKKRAIVLNLVYASGVILSFIVLALFILLSKQAGELVGWGFHLQSPIFVMILYLLFFFSAFYLLNLFKVPTPKTALNFKDNKMASHFITGVMSTTAASPCTVPFMAPAIGFALSRSFLEVFIIFFFLGLGLSFPYVLLSFFPGWFKYVPKPKKWMDQTKKILSIPLFLTILWLIYITYNQLYSYVFVLSLLIFVPATLLIVSQNFIHKTLLRKILIVTSIILILLTLFSTWYFNNTISSNKAVVSKLSAHKDLKWQALIKEDIDRDKRLNKQILVAVGADWCLVCKVSERVFLDRKIINFLKSNDIKLYYGDLTNKDEKIMEYLHNYGQSGIPFYLLLNGEMESKVLPTLLFKKSFLNTLKTFFQK